MNTFLKLETNDCTKQLMIKNIRVSIQDVKNKNPYNSICRMTRMADRLRSVT
jgi:hypothetical protein